MTQNGKKLKPPDISLYQQNRNRFPANELLPFAGLHVAWTTDGKQILASGGDLDELECKLVSSGIDPSQVVMDYIDPPDLVSL